MVEHEGIQEPEGQLELDNVEVGHSQREAPEE
jgi:hypothetical protein